MRAAPISRRVQGEAPLAGDVSAFHQSAAASVLSKGRLATAPVNAPGASRRASGQQQTVQAAFQDHKRRNLRAMQAGGKPMPPAYDGSLSPREHALVVALYKAGAGGEAIYLRGKIEAVIGHREILQRTADAAEKYIHQETIRILRADLAAAAQRQAVLAQQGCDPAG